MDTILLSGISICSKVILRRLLPFPNLSFLFGALFEGAIVHLSLEQGPQDEEAILISFIARIALDYFLSDRTSSQLLFSLIGCVASLYIMMRSRNSFISNSRSRSRRSKPAMPSAPIRVRSPPPRPTRQLQPREERPPHRASIGDLSVLPTPTTLRPLSPTSHTPGMLSVITEPPSHSTPEPGRIIIEPPTPSETSNNLDEEPREPPEFGTPVARSRAGGSTITSLTRSFETALSESQPGRTRTPSPVIRPQEITIEDLSTPESIIVHSAPPTPYHTGAQQQRTQDPLVTPRQQPGLQTPSEMSMLDGEFTERYARTSQSSDDYDSNEEETINISQIQKTPRAVPLSPPSVIITTEYVTPTSLQAEGEQLVPPLHPPSPVRSTSSVTQSQLFYTPSYPVQPLVWGTVFTETDAIIGGASSEPLRSASGSEASSGAATQMIAARSTTKSSKTQTERSFTGTMLTALETVEASMSQGDNETEVKVPIAVKPAGERDISANPPSSEAVSKSGSIFSSMRTAAEHLPPSSSRAEGRTVTSSTTMMTATGTLRAPYQQATSTITHSSESASTTETGTLTITQVHKKPQLLQHADGYRKQAKEAYEECVEMKLERAKALLEGNRVQALELYFDIQELEKRFKRLDRKAKRYYFRAHNPSNRIGEVDVHGLRVEEAIDETEKAVRQVHKSGLRKLKVITGWGKHSAPRGIPVLRSKILERLSVEHQLDATIQQGNPGALIISW